MIENNEVDICVCPVKELVAADLKMLKGLKVNFSSDQLDQGRIDQKTRTAARASRIDPDQSFPGSVIVDNFSFPGNSKTLYKDRIVRVSRIVNRSPARILVLINDGTIRGIPPLVRDTATPSDWAAGIFIPAEACITRT
jgi:hypothetical protein